MSAVAEYFDRIGKEVADRTRGAFPNPGDFTQLACEVLHRLPAPQIDVGAMADWVCSRAVLPKQINRYASFGEPALVVYEAEGFYVEILVWFPSRTAIHAHGFTGAFRVMDGASLQVEYAFQTESAPEEGVRLGKLKSRAIELIEPGKICPILDSNDFIHTVIHLGNPSLTLVLRTKRPKDKNMRQFSFMRCGFAFDPFLLDESLDRQSKLLLALFRARPDQLWPRLEAFLQTADQHQFHGLLTRLLEDMGITVFQKMILPGLESGFADKMPFAMSAVREEIRTRAMMQMMSALPNMGRQLQMALAELFPERAELTALIRHSFGGSEAERILAGWKAVLAAQTC